jgi:hypothetical protein
VVEAVSRDDERLVVSGPIPRFPWEAAGVSRYSTPGRPIQPITDYRSPITDSGRNDPLVAEEAGEEGREREKESFGPAEERRRESSLEDEADRHRRRLDANGVEAGGAELLEDRPAGVEAEMRAVEDPLVGVVPPAEEQCGADGDVRDIRYRDEDSSVRLERLPAETKECLRILQVLEDVGEENHARSWESRDLFEICDPAGVEARPKVGDAIGVPFDSDPVIEVLREVPGELSSRGTGVEQDAVTRRGSQHRTDQQTVTASGEVLEGVVSGHGLV